jgi:hypothetical protein
MISQYDHDFDLHRHENVKSLSNTCATNHAEQMSHFFPSNTMTSFHGLLKGNVAYFKILSQYLPGGTKESNKHISQDSQPLDQELKL